MEKLNKIISKAFAAVAIIGVFVAVCAKDDQDYEIIVRLAGVAAFIIGVVGWSLTSNGKEETI